MSPTWPVRVDRGDRSRSSAGDPASEAERPVGERHAGEQPRAVGDHVARAERDALAEHAQAVDVAVVADPHAAGDDAAAQRAVAADLGALRARRRARSSCSSPTVTPRSSTTRPPMRAPSPIRQPLSTSAGGMIRPGVLDAVLDAQVAVAHALAATPVRDRALEDVERPLQVALGRPDVEPVAVARRSRRGRRRRAAGRRRARSRRAASASSRSSTERSST